MPVVLERYDNRERYGDREIVEAVLSVDSIVVGTIAPIAKQGFKADTKGLVPIVDGITGASVDEVWARIETLVQAGQVRLTKLVTDVSYVRKS